MDLQNDRRFNRSGNWIVDWGCRAKVVASLGAIGFHLWTGVEVKAASVNSVSPWESAGVRADLPWRANHADEWANGEEQDTNRSRTRAGIVGVPVRRKGPTVCRHCKGGLGSPECLYCHGTGLEHSGPWHPQGASGRPSGLSVEPRPLLQPRSRICWCHLCGCVLKDTRRLRRHLKGCRRRQRPR